MPCFPHCTGTFASWMDPNMGYYLPKYLAFRHQGLQAWRNIHDKSCCVLFKYNSWSPHEKKKLSHFYRCCETCIARNLTSALEIPRKNFLCVERDRFLDAKQYKCEVSCLVSFVTNSSEMLRSAFGEMLSPFLFFSQDSFSELLCCF